MPAASDLVTCRLALQRGYVTRERIEEAVRSQEALREEMGVSRSALEILSENGWVTGDQALDLELAAAIESGEKGIVPGYEIDSVIGRGGMGSVYKAKRTADGRTVALKVVPPSLTTPEPLDALSRGAEAASALDHETIVPIIESAFEDGPKRRFLALGFVEGQDLKTRIARAGAIQPAEAVYVAGQVALALQQAYQSGTIHGDVKPSNVIVTADRKVKVLDFGLARHPVREAARAKRSGVFRADTHYVSPEVARGAEADTASDVYSLGAVLHHMLTGGAPFADASAEEALERHIDDTVEWPAETEQAIPEGLCRVVAKMMAKDPDGRYKTATELLLDLGIVGQGQEPVIAASLPESSTVALPGGRRRREPKRAARPKRAEKPGRVEKPRRVAAAAPARAKPHARRAGTDRTPAKGGSSSGALFAVVGAVVVLGIAAVAIFMSTSGKEPDVASSSEPFPSPPSTATTQPALSAAGRETAADREAAAEKAFGAAALYHKGNPEDLAGAIERFEKARDLGRGTAYQLKADAEAERLRGILRERATKALSEAEERAAGFAGEGDFDAALAELEKVPGDLASAVEADMSAAVKKVTDAAAAKLEAAIGEAARLVAGGDYAGAVVALKALDDIRYAQGLEGAATRVDALKTWIEKARKKAEDDALSGVRAELGKAYAEFDALLAKKEYAEAGRRMAAAARRKELASVADECRAAARVAAEFKKRPDSVRRGAENALGGAVSLETAKGRRKGTVDAVTDEGIRVASKITDRGRVVGETKITVKWQELTAAQEDELARAGGWEPAGPDAEVCFAYVAFWGDDLDAAEKRATAAGDHPVARHVAAKVASVRRGRTEAAAAAVWKPIAALAAREDLSQEQAEKLLADLDSFLKEHGTTAVAESMAGEIAGIRKRAEFAKTAAGLGRGLVGWWRFDEGRGDAAADSSPSGNHGRIRGARWVGSEGRVALSFDGQGDHVVVDNAPSLQVAGDQTISMWLCPAALGVRQNPYAKCYGGEGTFTIERGGNIIYFYGESGRNEHPYQGFGMPRRLEVGVWSHVVLVRDATARQLRWYKDGVEVSSGRANHVPAAESDMDLQIGRGYVQTFCGMIDDVRLYRRALTAEDVTLLHRTTAGRQPPPALGPEPPRRGDG